MIDEVGALLREAAAEAIMPRFRRLGHDQVGEKAPGEVVTVADRQAERIIASGLSALLPGSAVVGEEAAAADPDLLGHVADPGPVWLVDPLDGTANFAAGREPFAVMAALLRDGAIRAGWILDPVADTLVVAEEGAGAYRDGSRLKADTTAPSFDQLRGQVSTRFLPRDIRADVDRRSRGLGEVLPGQRCAGREYPDVITGRRHFSLFWRTLPWDHAPGALIAREAGAMARRPDGTPYRPADGRAGLLVAVNERVWWRVRDGLFGAGPSG